MGFSDFCALGVIFSKINTVAMNAKKYIFRAGFHDFLGADK